MNDHGISAGMANFNTLLVSASIVIAIAGSFAALDLAARARASSSRGRVFRITAAALAFGAGVSATS